MSKRWHVFIWFVIVLGLSLCFFGACKAQAQTLSAKQTDELKAAAVGAEIKSMRTKNAETFKADNKGKLTAKIYAHEKYYYDTVAKEYREKTFTYDGKAFASRGYSIEYKPLFKENTANLTTAKEQTATGVKETITLKNVDAPTLLSWTIVTNATYTLDGGAVTFTANGEVMFVTQAPTAWDRDGKPVKVTVSIDKGVLIYDVDVKAAAFPVTVDPTTTIISANFAKVYTSNADYATARNATTGDYIGVLNLYVGQYDQDLIHRFFITIVIPDITTLTAASLFLNGSNDESTTDFDIYIHISTCNTPVDIGDFDLFDGHQASGAYNGTILNDTWNTSSYSADWNEIVFNAAGLAAILAKKNDTFKLVAISSRDYAATAPSGAERVTFDGTQVPGNEPYLSITYTLSSGLESRKSLTAPRLYSNGDNVPLYKK